MISIIAGIGKHNELGKDNDLLWHLPVDMKHFKGTTSGHTVIMGQKTFESIGRALPKRRNIVVTRDTNFKSDNLEISNSLEDTLTLFKDTEEEVFVIGGGEIYKQSISHADKLYITHVDATFPDAEIFFPTIDENIWQKTTSEIIKKDAENVYDIEIAEYLRK